MLQLRQQKRFHAGLYSRQERYCRSLALSVSTADALHTQAES